MNKITALLDKSDYEIYPDFLNFRIVDYWLDEKLDELYPGDMYKGLVPTLDYGMVHEVEREIVWDRILPRENETIICPILMCPDDCDFSCTLIVAEIQNHRHFVQWKRMGLDETANCYGDNFGKSIRCLNKFNELNFEMKDYLIAIDSFRERAKKAKIDFAK
jgi:hypothetical protein